MFTKKNMLSFVGIALLCWSCQKIIHGYLSDRIFYQVNPFTVQQGVTTVSSSLVADGSTAPLHVKVLSLKDSDGNNADSVLTTPRKIVTYGGRLTYEDSTLALLNAKLKDSMVRPFNIAEIGGRLQFTTATSYVPAGSYNVDLLVSNVRGTEILKNACQIDITPTKLDSLLFTSCTTSPDAALTTATPVNNALSVSIDHSSGETNKIIFKFLDKNGKAFNPANGEVRRRTGRPSFANWDPYYAPVLTDSSIEYEYPEGVPQIPMFEISSYGAGFGKGIVYYQIQAAYTDLGLYVNPVAQMWFYLASGTYTVTYRLSNVARIEKSF